MLCMCSPTQSESLGHPMGRLAQHTAKKKNGSTSAHAVDADTLMKLRLSFGSRCS